MLGLAKAPFFCATRLLLREKAQTVERTDTTRVSVLFYVTSVNGFNELIVNSG